MFDIGWSEMAVIAVIALFVIGPKDLPKVLRGIGHYAGKVRAMAREFQASLDEVVRESELDEVKKQIEFASRFDVKRAVTDTIDPRGQLRTAFDAKPPPARQAVASQAPAAAESPAENPSQAPAPTPAEKNADDTESPPAPDHAASGAPR